MTSAWDGRILVVGAGLIGTSLGLAAGAAGADVLLTDADRRRLSLAESLGAGRAMPDEPPDDIDLVVIAAPPAVVGRLAADALRRGVGHTVTHVCSVQSLPQREVEATGVGTNRFLGSHPVAGREVSGPMHGTATLFRDRPWIVCPTAHTDHDAVELVTELARACGAHPVTLDADQHDRLFARLSHAPQLVASARAAALTGLPQDGVALAGPGVRDTTRLADSDPQMWADIATANAGPVAEALRAVTEPLRALADALESAAGDTTREDPPAAAAAAVRQLLVDGRAGRALLPGKHGGAPTELQVLQVAIPDRPGALAALLAAVADNGVNLEDLRVEHAPGQAVGTAELVVQPSVTEALESALQAAGWTVSSGPATPL
jgi:prephenate dehydrogenase